MECGLVVVYNAKKPFEYLWSLPERQWWKDNYEDHTVMIAIKIKSVDDFLGGDARVAATSAQHLASPAWAGVEAFNHGGYQNIAPPAPNGPAFEPPTGAKGKGAGKAGKADKSQAVAAKVKATPPAAVPNIPGNRCKGFNSGHCNDFVGKRVCSRSAKFVHYCSWCGGKHPVSACTSTNKNAPGNQANKNAPGTWNPKKRKWNQ